jgi:hypothetical protein
VLLCKWTRWLKKSVCDILYISDIEYQGSSVITNHIMYSVMEGIDQGSIYNTPSSYLHGPALTTSIINLSSEYNNIALHRSADQEYENHGEYKSEPATPTCQQDSFTSYPTSFTPSPSSSGCESPGNHAKGFNYFNLGENKDHLEVPFPAPPPPLSANHKSKDNQHGIPDTLEVKSQCSFSDEQVDCICDNLQNRGDIEMLGKETCRIRSRHVR